MASLKDAGKYLSLSDAIQTLKAELLKAESMATAEHSELLTLDECEIELAVEFKPKAEVGFDIYVFKVKTGAEAAGTHKLKVKYKPLRPIVGVARAGGGKEVVLSPKVPARKAGSTRA